MIKKQNTRVVVLAASSSKKTGEDPFIENAKIAMELAAACGEACPEVIYLFFSFFNLI